MISTTTGHCAATCGRKLEFWLDPAALHTVWDRTWNQWKHLLGAKIEVEGAFVQERQIPQAPGRVGTRHLGDWRCRAGWRSNCHPISI